MKSGYTLFILLLVCSFSFSSLAQTKPQPTPAPAPTNPRPGAPGAKTPYVLKKDYEAQMEAMSAKVNSARGAAEVVRRDIMGKLGAVDELNSKMQKVEEILNSANFQIALTSDSLKTTRNSMEEFRKDAEKTLEELHAADTEAESRSLLLMGLSILLPLVVCVLLFVKTAGLRKQLQAQSASMKQTLSDELKMQQENIKEELQALRTKLQGDVFGLRADLSSQHNRDKTDMQNQLKQLHEQVTGLDARIAALGTDTNPPPEA